MGRTRTSSSHIKSDANCMGGVVNSYHILPMSNKKRLELRDGQNLTTLVARNNIVDPVRRRAMIHRAKMLETKANYRDQAEKKGPDLWHVLVEFGTRKKLKQAAMSREEAAYRNRSVADLGMEWTLGQK